MVVNNPFMTKEEYFRSETYNGAIILPVLGNPLISLSLPNGYDGLAFVEGRQKCGMMIVNLILTDTIISGNKIQLAPGQTSGKARFRIYPNIEPLKEWVQLAFTATKTTGTVTCDMFKGGDHEDIGTELVKANLSNPEDLSDEDIGLEYVDFEFTLTEVNGNRPTLDTVSVKIEVGSSIPLLDIEFLKLAELINYTPADVLAKLLTVDGVNSGLNADKLDNQEGSYYLPASSYTAADVLNKLKTVHGPGSGLSADLFDNLDSSKFMYQHTDLGATNLNSITLNGLYHQPSSANAQGGSNYPVGMAGLLQVFASGSMIYQYYTVYDQDHQVYVRTCYNGTWFNWNELLDNNHMGSGSGIDADKLDGQEGSYYLPASSYTAADVKAKILTIDGAGSTIDSDKLDGQEGSYYGKASDRRSGWVLVGINTISSGSPVAGSSVSGLNGDVDGEYLLKIHVKYTNLGTAGTCSVALNGSYDGSSDITMAHTAVDGIGNASYMQIAATNAGAVGVLQGRAIIKVSGESFNGYPAGEATIRRYQGDTLTTFLAGFNGASTSNVTSVGFGMSNATFYGTVKLYKWVD